MKPRQNADSLADVPFPVGGIDLSTELEEQNPGTTPTGQNVRAAEANTQRLRGGSRPGIAQYIPARVNGIAAIQLLDATAVTTDPSGFGGSVYGPQGPGTPGTFIPPVGGSPGDPNAGQGGDGSGGNGGFGQTFNDDRPGDNSHFMHRMGTHNPITLVQFQGNGTDTMDVSRLDVAFNNQVQQGNMLFAAAVTMRAWNSPPYGNSATMTQINDSLGNHYTLDFIINFTGPNGLGTLTYAHCLSQASGHCTMSAILSQPDAPAMIIAEFHNVSSIQTVDSVSHATGTVLPAGPGLVSVQGTQELAVVAVAWTVFGGVPTTGGGFTFMTPFAQTGGNDVFGVRPGQSGGQEPGEGPLVLAVIYKAGLSSGVVPQVNLPQGASGRWMSVGATFKPQ